ncbi:MAG: NADP-dependent malic enzyme [Candidatus Bathyarchaeia archaeon]|nr:NADP-dependent malic enzyme [Candidatus Bathyarchaeota archaeon]
MIEPYGKMAVEWHRFYKGKIGVTIKTPITSYEDLAILYAPGVAQPCIEIDEDKEKIYEYTNVGNFVAVITDGSRVLGLGNIGRAGMPVIEAKALLFKYLGDVDAFPIFISTQDPDEIVQAVKWISQSFGGVNLEDIDAPKCFDIYDRLSKELDIPVFHDDQHGTAIVVLAALKNALKLAGKKLKELHIVMVGAGTAALASAKLLIEAGANAEDMIIVDSKGILYQDRPDMDKYKVEMAAKTNRRMMKGSLRDALKGADVAIALSKPGPGVLTRDMISTMADKPIIFALANPTPEIPPEEALEAGAKIVATGRADYPNQINNSICFPAVFRGLLDVRARGVNTSIMLAAAYEIGRYAEEQGLSEKHILPTMMDTDLYPRVAAAVGRAAIESGVARVKHTYEDLMEMAQLRISRYRKTLHLLMKEGIIPPPPTLKTPAQP